MPVAKRHNVPKNFRLDPVQLARAKSVFTIF